MTAVGPGAIGRRKAAPTLPGFSTPSMTDTRAFAGTTTRSSERSGSGRPRRAPQTGPQRPVSSRTPRRRGDRHGPGGGQDVKGRAGVRAGQHRSATNTSATSTPASGAEQITRRGRAALPVFVFASVAQGRDRRVARGFVGLGQLRSPGRWRWGRSPVPPVRRASDPELRDAIAAGCLQREIAGIDQPWDNGRGHPRGERQANRNRRWAYGRSAANPSGSRIARSASIKLGRVPCEKMATSGHRSSVDGVGYSTRPR